MSAVAQLKYPRIEDLIEAARTRVKNDLDCLMLFFGDVGSGKSTLAAQIGAELDPNFARMHPRERVDFSIIPFIRRAPAIPKGGFRLLDESPELDALEMMSDDVRALSRHFVKVRARNHYMAVCFPYESLFNKRILNTRVWLKFEVARPTYKVFERARFKYFNRRTMQEKEVYRWELVGMYDFQENKGAWWDAYKELKSTTSAQLDEDYLDEMEETRRSTLRTGVDHAHAVAHFRSMLPAND